MHESWKDMQVPIFGIIGILLIFVLVAFKLGVTTDEYVTGGYAHFFPLDNIEGEACSDQYDPVCCSDGVTYDNLCLCKSAGVTPEYQGICR